MVNDVMACLGERAYWFRNAMWTL